MGCWVCVPAVSCNLVLLAADGDAEAAPVPDGYPLNL